MRSRCAAAVRAHARVFSRVLNCLSVQTGAASCCAPSPLHAGSVCHEEQRSRNLGTLKRRCGAPAAARAGAGALLLCCGVRVRETSTALSPSLLQHTRSPSWLTSISENLHTEERAGVSAAGLGRAPPRRGVWADWSNAVPPPLRPAAR